MKRLVLPLLLVSAFLVSGCSIVPLDEYRQSLKDASFDPQAYTENIWNTKLLPNLDDAVDIGVLYDLIAEDLQDARARYGRSIGLGNIYYYFLKGQGRVVTIESDQVGLTLGNSEDVDVYIKTGFIFGNTVRNATQLIDVNDFPNSQDFNNISKEINRLITDRVVPSFIAEVQEGMLVKFVGGTEIASDEDLYPMVVIPVHLQLQ
ncbi:MAG: DUF2291 domain-containing protein [Firmicutes bacterium]|nr:DUF2291 domain-containing protein [Bacillota bacterium]